MDAEKIAEQCLAISALAAVAMTVVFWGSWFVVIGAWLLAFPFAMLLGLIMGCVGRAQGVEVDDPKLWVDETDELVLEFSPETIGAFQGEKIHEWIILKRPDNGEPIRLNYNRTIDLSHDESFEPPENEWFCVLPPGIMFTEPEKA